MNLNKIEDNFSVDQLKNNGVCVWPIVKSYLIGIIGEVEIIKEATNSTIKILLRNLMPDLMSISNLKKSQFWVFTNSERRYHVNEQSFDRVTSGLLRFIDDYILFENPVPKGRTKRKNIQKGEYLVGMSWIFLAQFLVLKFSKKQRIENLSALESFLDKDLNKINSVFHRICAGEKVYDYLIKKYQPKAIFVVCYYSNFEVIKAAKRNNIPIIELQHGMVSTGHRAYYFTKDYGNEHLPDYFLSYGAYSSKVVTEGHLVKQGRTLDYGYSFLEEVGSRLTISKELKTIKNKFKKVICITGQLPVTDVPLLKMIKDVHHLFPEICFIYKPRFPDTSFPLEQGKNFIQLSKANTYELLKYCDFHITVYSTCALEALALGTPNIAVDIKGYYKQFLKPMLEGVAYNHEVFDLPGLKRTLETLEEEFDRKDVKKSINHIFSGMVDSKTFFQFFEKIVE